MGLKLSEKSLPPLTYYHRDYKNDLPKKDASDKGACNQTLRIGQASLPFLAIYRPFGRALTTLTGGSRAIFCLSKAYSDISKGVSKGELASDVLQTGIAIISFGSSIFAHPLGMIVTTCHDLGINVVHLYQAWVESDSVKAREAGLQILNNSVYLGVLIVGSNEALVASLALQILSGLYQTSAEFNKGNYIEVGAGVLMAVIRVNQIAKPISLLHTKWKLESANKKHAIVAAIANDSSAKSDITRKNHPEFSPLLRKIQNLINFENLGFRNGVNSRDFCIGSDAIGKNKVFIKSPMGKHIFIRQTWAKNEQLAFLISHRLNLGVVPPTMALEGFADTIEAALPKSILQHVKVGCDPKTYENSYAGVVVQEGILLEEDQTLFNRDSLDMTQIQKAVLFNLITGRTDSGPNNTVVAQLGKIMELDNEKLGLSMTDSWLLREFSEMFFDPAVIDDFLSKPIHTVRHVFEEMHAFNFDQSTKSTISQNFDKIREFLILNNGNQVKVKDLADFFYRLTNLSR